MTDLQKILTVSGESGLFLYLSQGKGSVIAESLNTKKRIAFGINAKVTSLSDISIYTESDEIRLQELLEKMRDHLSSGPAMDPKSNTKLLVAFFEEILPDYDKDRFYTSHMKKVIQWYNILQGNGSLDFKKEEVGEETTEEVGAEA